MGDKKLVSIDVDGIKEKATQAAKTATAAAKTRVTQTRDTIKTKARAQTDKALSMLLNKGIELSEKQVKTLKNVQKRFG